MYASVQRTIASGKDHTEDDTDSHEGASKSASLPLPPAALTIFSEKTALHVFSLL